MNRQGEIIGTRRWFSFEVMQNMNDEQIEMQKGRRDKSEEEKQESNNVAESSGDKRRH
ncbi:Hypothetical predicted protein [Olea europaea subsp. europaea]|uniref:Uncharacterized protein n=1 Tax=Olea europaea subsp. europaea TaxID=158383 RepID=A0A8S0R2U7_OLEEU|nr:Hypothetical predicted protein [Olea europaea subsp. europaea]